MHHRKVHLFDLDEEIGFTAGEDEKVGEVDGVRVAIAIATTPTDGRIRRKSPSSNRRSY